jgi:Flp pilus assembly protein TadD
LKYLGITLVESQDFKEGLRVLDQAIALGVDDALLRNSHGIALDNLGKAADAIRSYRRALEINPDYDQPRLNLAFSLLRVGRKEEAAAEFERLCQSGSQFCKRYAAQFQNALLKN